jgi:3-hydroxypropanoate dehydrogenase
MNITTEQILTEAHTAAAYLDTPVSDDTLHALYELLKWGPTSSNCNPARFMFVRSNQAKEKLITCMNPGNVNKVRQAPVTVLVGMDMAFYEHLPKLFPHVDARAWFVGKPAVIEANALRNSSLQAGYMILAARALGLDCGPMGGFDAAKMDAAFWAGTQVKSNLVCCLGQADASKTRPRGPRLSFDEACVLA